MGCVYRKLKGGRDLGWYPAFVDTDSRRHHVATKQITKGAATPKLSRRSPGSAKVCCFKCLSTPRP